MLRSHRLIIITAALVLLAGGGVLMFKPWHSNAQQPGRTQFAEDRGGRERSVPFDPARAMQYLERICDIGPRISGTPGMAKLQEMLTRHFESCGGKVELQKFTARQRSQKQPVEMANLLVRWHPDRPRRIILCTHYDTRPRADQEFNPRDWDKPFLAANDGGSGVALLMELAHHMSQLDLRVGVDFVCFDGEEYIFDNRPMEQGGDLYFFGSEHFAREYVASRSRKPPGPTYLKAILLDMVGGKNPTFYWEQYSIAQAGPLCEEVWGIAREVGATSFVRQTKHFVLDDHLALLKVRIPAIDIIDFDYPHWHRLSDVPANCSGESLEQVARVLVVWMQRAR